MNPFDYAISAFVVLVGIVAVTHAVRFQKQIDTGKVREEDAMYVNFFGARMPAIVLLGFVIGIGALLNVVLTVILAFKPS